MTGGLRVVFIHPDLGIGGAEKAVIDAALALKSHNHSVEFVTAHHDITHCFTETRDGTLQVTTAGDWLPRSVFGHFYALCAYLRMIYAAIYLVFFSGKEFDAIFCDQISVCIPILKLRGKKVLFYCHFPDMLLTQRKSFLKRIYRAPLDWLEERTTGMADKVLVNSRFTSDVFRQTFTSLGNIEPEILYPIPNFDGLNLPVEKPTPDLLPRNGATIFLSINRYERKKNLPLAIKALGVLKNEGIKDVHLVMAGGYDERVTENREHYLELRHLASNLSLTDDITFLRSFSDAQKRTLLSQSTALLYTPDREHFGIVPIEAMYMRCPVIAVNSGGPLETVADQETGFLCEQTPQEFAAAMKRFINDKTLSRTLGEAGHGRVVKLFSFDAFTVKLNKIIEDLSKNKNK